MQRNVSTCVCVLASHGGVAWSGSLVIAGRGGRFAAGRVGALPVSVVFSPQMETIVFVILQIFYATRSVLKIGVYLVHKPLPAAGISADNVRG